MSCENSPSSMNRVSWFFQKIFLIIWKQEQTKRDRDKERKKIFHRLVHSPNGSAGLKVGASSKIPTGRQGSKYLGHLPTAFLDISRELDRKWGKWAFNLCPIEATSTTSSNSVREVKSATPVSYYFLQSTTYLLIEVP